MAFWKCSAVLKSANTEGSVKYLSHFLPAACCFDPRSDSGVSAFQKWRPIAALSFVNT